MFSDVVNGIEEAGSIRVNEMVYKKKVLGEDVTVLSLGEAFFKIPIYDFNELDFNQGYHYSESRGVRALRNKLADYYKNSYGVQANPEKNILISTGSKICVYMSIMALINKGDEVIIHEPYWVSYPEQIKLCKGNVKALRYDVPAAQFRNFISKNTKLVILNNPNNPAGSVYSKEDLLDIYAVCKENGTYLLVDEAYSDFCLNNEFYSAGLVDHEFKNLIIVNSLSKNLGMSGWRIGYIISNEKFIYEVLKLNQHLITCAPTILQQYMAHNFDSIVKCTKPQIEEVVKKRHRIAREMDRIGLKYLESASTFYFFVDISKSKMTSKDFADHLIQEYSVAVVPGIAYGNGTDHFVRIGVGTESEERIIKALEIIKKLNSKD